MPQKVFGPVTISWPDAWRDPIALDTARMSGDDFAAITQCAIRYTRDGVDGGLVVPADFAFDGATIPRRFWHFRGFAPFGRHIWASALHDYLCRESEAGRFDRVVADSIFAALLVHSGIEPRRAAALELGVELYRWLRRIAKALGLKRRPKT
jgi:hypothetical protein